MHQGFRMAWLKSQSLAKMSDGSLTLPLPGQGQSEMMMNLGCFGPKTQCTLIGIDGFPMFATTLEGYSEELPGIRVSRLLLHHLTA
jgi:hypothetical protein